MNITGEKQFGETKDLYDTKIHVGVSKLGGKEAGKWQKGHHLLNRVTGLFLHLFVPGLHTVPQESTVTWWE